MGGWFTQEITSTNGFKGLRYRMAGPGAEVLRRLGAVVVLLPGGEIMSKTYRQAPIIGFLVVLAAFLAQ